MQYRSGNSYWETANYADATVLNKALDFAPDAVYEEKPVSAEFTLETLPLNFQFQLLQKAKNLLVGIKIVNLVVTFGLRYQ